MMKFEKSYIAHVGYVFTRMRTGTFMLMGTGNFVTRLCKGVASLTPVAFLRFRPIQCKKLNFLASPGMISLAYWQPTQNGGTGATTFVKKRAKPTIECHFDHVLHLTNRTVFCMVFLCAFLLQPGHAQCC